MRLNQRFPLSIKGITGVIIVLCCGNYFYDLVIHLELPPPSEIFRTWTYLIFQNSYLEEIRILY
jgi:hypothetical protein